jgi:hypothetical protein
MCGKKKLAWLCAFLVCLPFAGLTAQEIHEYPAALAARFTPGSGRGQLGGGAERDTFGPIALCFDGAGNLYILDSLNNRVVILDSRFGKESHLAISRIEGRSSPFIYSHSLEVVPGGILGGGDQCAVMIDDKGETVFFVTNVPRHGPATRSPRLFERGFDNSTFIFHDDALFFNVSGAWYAVRHPRGDVILAEDNCVPIDDTGLPKDGSGRYDNRSYQLFFNLDNAPNALGYGSFIGRDRDGNRYWWGVPPTDRTLCIIVTDAAGTILDAIRPAWGGTSALAVHPDGDLYCLNSTNAAHYLYRISRRWGYAISRGRVTDTGVRLRDAPHLQGNVSRSLYKGEELDVLTRSGEKMKVGKDEAYWYKVRTIDGLIGWAYGAFIDVKKP